MSISGRWKAAAKARDGIRLVQGGSALGNTMTSDFSHRLESQMGYLGFDSMLCMGHLLHARLCAWQSRALGWTLLTAAWAGSGDDALADFAHFFLTQPSITEVVGHALPRMATVKLRDL